MQDESRHSLFLQGHSRFPLVITSALLLCFGIAFFSAGRGHETELEGWGLVGGGGIVWAGHQSDFSWPVPASSGSDGASLKQAALNFLAFSKRRADHDSGARVQRLAAEGGGGPAGSGRLVHPTSTELEKVRVEAAMDVSVLECIYFCTLSDRICKDADVLNASICL